MKHLYPLFVIILVLLTQTLHAASTVDVGDLQYKINTTDKVARVAGLSAEGNKKNSWNLTIPATIKAKVNDKTITFKVIGISARAFYGIEAPLNVKFEGKNLQTIGDYAFYFCEALNKGKAIVIPEGVTSIGEKAFASSSMGSVSLPSTIRTIARYAFDQSDITALTFNNPTSAVTIKEYAFSSCEKLKSVALPATLTSLGECAFYKCSALTSLSISGVATIPTQAFAYCTRLDNITIGEGISTIGQHAFEAAGYSTNSRLNLKLPASLRIIERSAFHDADLGWLALPPGVTHIYESAFEGTNLASLWLPASVQLIAGEAFYELNQLYNIRCDAVTPPALGTDVFGERTLKYAEVTVPDASFASYSNASGWRDFEWFKKKGAIDDTADDIADGETPRYYDLQGNRIDPSLAVPGIYIRRTSKTTSKIYLR